MVKLSISLIAVVLLLGCTSKNQKDLMASYSTKTTYHKQLQKTEKVQLYHHDMTKAMLTATYLYTPSFENNDTRDEVFIVGLHLADKAYANIKRSEYSLTLNGHKAEKTKVLRLDDEQLRNLAFVTDWASYYLVTFPHTSSNKITLVFESKLYGKGELHFAKVAKYVLNKGAF